MRIKTVEHGDKLISGFGNEVNANWKPGDKVDIIVTQRGEYLNFEMPRRDAGPAANSAGTAELKNILMLKVIPMLQAIYEEVKKESDYPQMDETNNAEFDAVIDRENT